MGGRRCDVLSQCERTTVQSPFLEALLSGETKKYYPGEWASNFLAQGHDRVQPARQALCYILRQALGIVRMPNTYDVKIRADLFDNIDPSDLDSAVEDARRIYEFTQAEMKRVWAEDTITLKRGLRDKEAGVARALFDELGPETQTVPLYFNSLTFFNYVSGAFHGPLTVSVPCPIEWIWASQYTLADLEQGQSCEEFIVACLDPRATMELPLSAFEWWDSRMGLPKIRITGIGGYSGTLNARSARLSQAMSYLIQEGLEPTNNMPLGLKYNVGNWEGRFTRLARKLILLGNRLDQRLSYTSSRSSAHIEPRE